MTRRRQTLAPMTILKLWVEAGGRCEFGGCNADLLRDNLTLQESNFAHIAHIVGASIKGPRGRNRMPPSERNQRSNLMLLCRKHHALIDDKRLEAKYPKAYLLDLKKSHEKRIYRLAGLLPGNKTTLLRLRSRIGTETSEIPHEDMHEAILPRYPTDLQGIDIDLSPLGNSDRPEFWGLAAAQIKDRIGTSFAPGIASGAIQHVSVFALAPIPLLVHLGRCLSNKIPAALYQKHRGTEDWHWRPNGKPVRYTFHKLKSGLDRRRVAMVVSLSGTVPIASLPFDIRTRCSLYQITLADIRPSPMFLRRAEDLERFIQAYHELLSQIQREHPRATEIHLFAAAPAPIAIACGREILPRVYPNLVLYDFDKTSKGWNLAL